MNEQEQTIELTCHQRDALEVLLDIGGWAATNQLRYHGVTVGALLGLENKGIIDRREIGVYGTKEWRVKLDWLPSLLEFIKKDSILSILMESSILNAKMANSIKEHNFKTAFSNINTDVKH